MEFDIKKLNRAQIYKLMTGVVVPRPIAWVTTISDKGVVNLAPFSSFTFVSHSPPMLAVGVEDKAGGGGLKDTSRNILESGEFVIHIADQTLLSPLHESAAELPADVSEVEFLGLKMLPSVGVRVPRLAAAKIAVECKLHKSLDLGLQPMRLMIGEVLYVHVNDDVVDVDKVDTRRLDPICRLAGPNYASLGEIMKLAPGA